ncbi:hypothetical protein LCGC14_2319170, partial [marine sediment metagenome]
LEYDTVDFKELLLQKTHDFYSKALNIQLK